MKAVAAAPIVVVCIKAIKHEKRGDGERRSITYALCSREDDWQRATKAEKVAVVQRHQPISIDSQKTMLTSVAVALLTRQASRSSASVPLISKRCCVNKLTTRLG